MRRIVLVASLVIYCLATSKLAWADWTAGIAVQAQTSDSDTSASLSLDSSWQKQWRRQQLQLGYGANIDHQGNWQLTGNSSWDYQRTWLTLAGGHQRALSTTSNNILTTDRQMTDSVNLSANLVSTLSSTSQLILLNSATANGASKQWPQRTSWQSGISGQRKLSRQSNISLQWLRNEAFANQFGTSLSTTHSAQASFNRTRGQHAFSLSLGNTWVADSDSLTGTVNFSRPLAGLQQSWTIQHSITQEEGLSRNYQASWQVSQTRNKQFSWQSGLTLLQSEAFAGPTQFTGSANIGGNYRLSQRSTVRLNGQYQQQRNDWQSGISAELITLNTGFTQQINQTLTLSGDFSRATVLTGDANDTWMSSLSLRQQIR